MAKGRGVTETAATARLMRKSGASHLVRARHRAGLMFAMPAILLVTAITVIPLAQALYYSFTDWNGATANWTGLRNYINVFRDPELKQALINSSLIMLSIPFGMMASFVTAYMLSRGVVASGLMRSLIFAPTALSWVVIGVVARQVLANEGPLTDVLSAVGLDSLTMNWLAGPSTAMLSLLVVFNAAVFGVNTVIFLTAMSTVDRSTIEAARIDGASEARILIEIILPAVRRFVEFVFIITMVASFTGIFGLIYVMTGGGPGSATMTLEFAVWRRALATGAFGPGAAIGISLMVLVLMVIALVRRFSRSEGPA
jgi:multiple sugar transport system permease protein